MIRNGIIQDLAILRRTKDGLVLGDEDGEVVLPLSERPQKNADGNTVRVFVHRDPEGRFLATAKVPRVQLGGFASLRVNSIDRHGAHMDWGLRPDLLVPHNEQRRPLEEGRWYVVRMAIDERTDRLFGSTRIEDHLDNDRLTVHEGDAVELVVYGRSDLGLAVVVNDLHQGLVHANEIFKHVSIGDRITGYVKRIRDDHKLDITLQPIGYRQYIDANTAMLARRIQGRGGFLPFSDKSSAEEIHAEFGISKKAFKKALGALYKDRLVRIEEAGVVWVG
ncbi:MAG: S1-like domain-containing RNA-binding protein [Flavobacteriales bacterium]|nr:GntR family transcriptional regulator [Flavobacteriales bacterium]